MESITEFIMCIFTQNRKSDEPVFKLPKNTPLDDEKFKLIEECSWYGCGLEFGDHRPIYQKAKRGNFYHAFCCEECYVTWLKLNYY